MEMEDYPNAIDIYNKVLAIDPNHRSTLDNLGYCYLAKNNYSAALEKFKKCIDLQPDLIDALIGITLTYYYQNDLVNAKKYLDRAKEVKPILKQGVNGYEIFKKEGWFYSDKDDNALKKMFVELK